jgi:hypothetical protein
MGKNILFIVTIICWVWYIHHNGEVTIANATKDIANEETPKKVETKKTAASKEETSKNVETEKPTTTVKQESPKPEYVRLLGRGNCDTATGEEPQYVGLTGFVVVNYMDHLTNYDTKFPQPPWQVNTVKQVGPNQFQDTNITVPHKTKVKVLKQMLWDEGMDIYSGALLVEDVNTKRQFLINVENFMTYPYWEDKIQKASQEGKLIAVYNGKGSTPVADGKYVELKPGTEVVVDDFDTYTNKVKAQVYKVWELGYGGVDAEFDPSSLDIKY